MVAKENYTAGLTLALLFATASADAQTVSFDLNTQTKRSRSAICHPQGTMYYDRVTRPVGDEEPLRACLEKNGRLPVIYQAYGNLLLACAREPAGENCSQLEESKTRTTLVERDTKTFAGFKVSPGIAAITFSDPKIEDVQIVDGKVVVGDRRNTITTVVLESHRFFTPESRPNLGYGPFLVVPMGVGESSKRIPMFGLGFMVGFKQADSSSSWNVGLGVVVDTDALELREGLKDGIRTAETRVDSLTRKVDSKGWMVLVSASW